MMTKPIVKIKQNRINAIKNKSLDLIPAYITNAEAAAQKTTKNIFLQLIKICFTAPPSFRPRCIRACGRI